DQDFNIVSRATGGAGGGAGPLNYYGNGGDGGTATASAHLSSAANYHFQSLYANVVAEGGVGGSGYGPGFSGGAGGLATINPSSINNTADNSIVLQVYQGGGAGGAGLNFANGGNGADSFISDKISGSANPTHVG